MTMQEMKLLPDTQVSTVDFVGKYCSNADASLVRLVGEAMKSTPKVCETFKLHAEMSNRTKDLPYVTVKAIFTYLESAPSHEEAAEVFYMGMQAAPERAEAALQKRKTTVDWPKVDAAVKNRLMRHACRSGMIG